VKEIEMLEPKTRAARKLSISIDRAAADAYEFLSLPENFPKWASGLAGSLRQVADGWVAETPEGPATVRFSERNAHGVLDHAVDMPRGSVYVPLRVIPRGKGCELVLTLFPRPEASDEMLAADAEWVMRDLQAAKRIVESLTESVPFGGSMNPSTGSNPAPGYKKYPNHHITAKPAGRRVQVKSNGEVIADTMDAIELHEPHVGHVVSPVVYYIPRKDVKMERLVPTSHTTHCPFKGDASYFSLKNGPENAVWSYEQPYDELLAIKDLLAFYPDKVDSITAEGAGR
jgi:uncharacterized protein (DUF427 family)